MEIVTPCKIETLEQIVTEFVKIDYVDPGKVFLLPNLVKIRLRKRSGQSGET